jgi:hypothetical protein
MSRTHGRRAEARGGPGLRLAHRTAGLVTVAALAVTLAGPSASATPPEPVPVPVPEAAADPESAALSQAASVDATLTPLGAPFASAVYDGRGALNGGITWSSAAVGDVTGDGRPDIVTSGFDGRVRVHDTAGAVVRVGDTGGAAVSARPPWETSAATASST